MKGKSIRIGKGVLAPLFIFSILLIAFCSVGIGIASAQTAVSIDPLTKTVDYSEEFTLNIKVDPAVAIAGMQCNLAFDPSVVTVNSVTEGNLLSQDGASTYFAAATIDNVAGTVTGIAGAITMSGATVSNKETFAVVTLTAGSVDGTTTIDLSNVVVGDINGDAVDVEVSGGSVTVGEITVTPTPTPTSSPTKTLDPKSPFASPNNPPNTPSVPEGSSSGYVRTTYTYTTAATDPDGDKIKYRLDWGDGRFSDWSLSASSGSSVSRSHSWSRAGTYYVRAQVEDTDGETSSWSSHMAVNISQSTNSTSTAMATSTLTATPTSKDTDGDGISDIDELVAGTDPQDKNDWPSAASALTIAPAPTPASTPTATPTATPTPTPAPELTSVTASMPEPAIPTPEEEPDFEAVLAIASLLAVAYLALRKRK